MRRPSGLPGLLLLGFLAGCQFDPLSEDYAQSDAIPYRILQRPDGSRQLETRIPVPFREFFRSWSSSSISDQVHLDSTPPGQTEGVWWRQSTIYDAQPWGVVQEFWFGWWLLDIYQLDRQHQTSPIPFVSQGVAQLFQAFQADAYKGYTFTKYYPPENATKLDSSFSGTSQQLKFGIYFRVWPLDTLVVAAAPRGTPAGNAGLQNGDRILTVNGHRATLDYLIDSVGTQSLLFVYFRPGAGIDSVDIARAPVSMPTVYADTLPGGIGYISIREFSQGDSTALPIVSSTDLQFQAAAAWVDSVSKPGAPWILDLMSDGGGAIGVAQNIASSILPAGDNLVQLTERQISQSSPYQKGQDATYLLPVSMVPPHLRGRSILILQDSATASASELVISALRENLGSGVREFGGTTFGKGIGQTYFPTPLGGFMAVTNLHIDPINNKPSYHHIGIPPDVSTSDDSAAAFAWRYATSAIGAARGLTNRSMVQPNFSALKWNRGEGQRLHPPPELPIRGPFTRDPNF